MVDINRDQYGRPLVPHPVTGEKHHPWTRTTTLASTISDRRAIERWAQRQLIKGVAVRGDELVLRAAAAGDDRDELDNLIEVALEAAKTKSAADIGTALHRLTERIDNGENPIVPEPFLPDITAYFAALNKAGIAVADGWVERFVITPDIDAAGTPDRLINMDEWPDPLIFDIKTGRNAIKYGLVEIGAQLAGYSRASHWYDGEQLHEMPKVDQHHAVVAHLPAGEGRCDLYLIDLIAGWEIAQTCHQARQLRTRHDIATPLAPKTSDIVQQLADSIPDEPSKPLIGDFSVVENETVRRRVAAVKVALDGGELPRPWPTTVTPPSKQTGDYTDADIKAIHVWLGEVEPALNIVPF